MPVQDLAARDRHLDTQIKGRGFHAEHRQVSRRARAYRAPAARGIVNLSDKAVRLAPLEP